MQFLGATFVTIGGSAITLTLWALLLGLVDLDIHHLYPLAALGAGLIAIAIGLAALFADPSG